MLSQGQDTPPNNYSSGNVVLQGAPCGQCRELCPAGYVPHFWRWVPSCVTYLRSAFVLANERSAGANCRFFSALSIEMGGEGGGGGAVEVKSQKKKKNEIPTRADPGKILRSVLCVMGGSIRCWKKKETPRKTGKMIVPSCECAR